MRKQRANTGCGHASAASYSIGQLEAVCVYIYLSGISVYSPVRRLLRMLADASVERMCQSKQVDSAGSRACPGEAFGHSRTDIRPAFSMLTRRSSYLPQSAPVIRHPLRLRLIWQRSCTRSCVFRVVCRPWRPIVSALGTMV